MATRSKYVASTGLVWNGAESMTPDVSRSRKLIAFSIVKNNPLPPTVVIEKIIIGDESIEPPFSAKGQKLVFSPGKNEFEIRYTGLSLLVPERVLFRIKLEGHDSQWKEMGQRRFTNYNNLAPGNYTFRVTACMSKCRGSRTKIGKWSGSFVS